MSNTRDGPPAHPAETWIRRYTHRTSGGGASAPATRHTPHRRLCVRPTPSASRPGCRGRPARGRRRGRAGRAAPPRTPAPTAGGPLTGRPPGMHRRVARRRGAAAAARPRREDPGRTASTALRQRSRYCTVSRGGSATGPPPGRTAAKVRASTGCARRYAARARRRSASGRSTGISSRNAVGSGEGSVSIPPTPSTSASTAGSTAQTRGSEISACHACRAVQPGAGDDLGASAERGRGDVGPQPRVVGGFGPLRAVEGERVAEHQQHRAGPPSRPGDHVPRPTLYPASRQRG